MSGPAGSPSGTSDFGTIGRADLHGNNVDESFIPNAGGPSATLTGIAVDANHIYWASFANGTISRADLSGANVVPNIVTGGSGLKSIAVDGLAFPASPGSGSSPGTTAPNTELHRAKINQAHHWAKFEFSSTEAGSTFLCRLDKKQFKPCTSPKVYRHLKRGQHRFQVKARDAAGNIDPTPVSDRFASNPEPRSMATYPL